MYVSAVITPESKSLELTLKQGVSSESVILRGVDNMLQTRYFVTKLDAGEGLWNVL